MTNVQLNDFHQEGYLRIERPFNAEYLRAWQRKVDSLENALNPETAINTFFYPTGELGRANDLMRYFPEDVISLLASEPILEIAHKICGENVVPLTCDLLIKRNGPSSVFNWHQDVVHSREYPFIVIGIYLDDSNPNDGPLSIVKGSHFEKHPISQSEPSFTAYDVLAKAGDIIIHDAMILHHSEMKKEPGKRRTLYIEMRPYEAIIADGFQSQKWADLRKKWMEFIMKKANATWRNKFSGAISHSLMSLDQFVPELLNEFSPYPPAHYG